MRRLIINADDFGLTRGVNLGIAEGCRQGVITSTTLMATGPAFADAVTTATQWARCAEGSAIGIGCHVVLVDGEPVLPPSRIPSLLAEGTESFHRSLGAFARALFRGRLRAEQIEAEATAQIRKIQSAGIAVSHVDTHKHVHMFPAVLKPFLRAARACGVRAVRNPFAPSRPLGYAHLLRRPRLWKRYTQVKLLRVFAGEFRRQVQGAGFATTAGTFGIVVTGALDEPLLHAIVASIPDGSWELCCHPGYSDADLDGVATRLRASRDGERRVLASAATRELLAKSSLELITYRDLQ